MVTWWQIAAEAPVYHVTRIHYQNAHLYLLKAPGQPVVALLYIRHTHTPTSIFSYIYMKYLYNTAPILTSSMFLFALENKRVASKLRQGRVSNHCYFHFRTVLVRIYNNYEIMELKKYLLQFIFTLVVTFKVQSRKAHIKDIGLTIFDRINIGLNAKKGLLSSRKRRDNHGEDCPKLDDAPVRHQVISNDEFFC